MEDVKVQIQKLQTEIEKHDEAYHHLDSPLISDATYDQLKKKLEEYRKNFPENFDEEDKKVGAKILENFSKIRHKKPMLSLANGFTREDIEDFIDRVNRFLGLDKNNEATDLFSFLSAPKLQLFCETKIDGLSFSARFENGKLIYAATRGDGETGEDVTQNVKMIQDFPQILNTKFPPKIFEMRGEIYMSKQDFAQLNSRQEELGEKLFANPRNAAAGSLRQLDPNITASRKLKYFAYSAGEFSGDFTCKSQQELIQKLREFGFRTEEHSTLCANIDEVLQLYNKICDQRYELDYDIDGMVYKVNSFEFQERLGFVARSPRWAIAHKFPAEKAKTKIENIIVQIGRTGALTPVAILTPINIGGVLVSRATLHNQDEITRKDIRINDVALIQRAGDVIPQILEIDLSKRSADATPFFLPSNCPICNSKIIKTNDDVVMRCSGGLSCDSQLKETLKHFVSKDAFDITGLGKKQIENFFIEGRIKKFIDIFKLEEADKSSPNPLSEKFGWGEKSAVKLFAAINQKRKISLEKFIYAIGIRHIGETMSKLIAQHFTSYKNFKNTLLKIAELSPADRQNNQQYQDLVAIDGIGEKITNAIAEYFCDEKNLQMIDGLDLELEIIDAQIKNATSEFAGKSIVFTGSLEKMTRMEAKKKAEDLGMKVVGSVSAKTDFVVAGSDAGSKLKKAKELEVKILSEDEWLEMAS